LGTGQEYSDLQPFDKNIFLETVFGSLNDVKIEQTNVSKLKSEPTPEPIPEPELISNDPFEGITDNEITTYSDLFDIPPPETDVEAIKTGKKIRDWIKNGKPGPGESTVITSDEKEVIHKQDKEGKPQKKRGLFGRFKK